MIFSSPHPRNHPNSKMIYLVWPTFQFQLLDPRLCHGQKAGVLLDFLNLVAETLRLGSVFISSSSSADRFECKEINLISRALGV